MALNEALPYGMHDIKIATISSAGVKGSVVDLPNARKMSWEEAEDFETLRGDDRDVTTRGKGPAVSFEIEEGGISLEALVIINGGTLTITGVTPSVKKKYTKKSTDQRPFFFAEGQALSESGGDFHAVLYRCKAEGGVNGEMADGAFWLTGASGKAYGSTFDSDAIYDLVANETAAAIA